jgi:hypothetical protein
MAVESLLPPTTAVPPTVPDEPTSAPDLESWLLANPLKPIYVDCAVAVMLKILDGKCKMKEGEKWVMAALYHGVKHMQGEFLGADTHELIAHALAEGELSSGARPSVAQAVTTTARLSEARILEIYEQRVLAETRIARPSMKAFKSWIREQGLFRVPVAPLTTR